MFQLFQRPTCPLLRDSSEPSVLNLYEYRCPSVYCEDLLVVPTSSIRLADCFPKKSLSRQGMMVLPPMPCEKSILHFGVFREVYVCMTCIQRMDRPYSIQSIDFHRSNGMCKFHIRCTFLKLVR